ncbi:sigma 54-interacting transcriptional regulator [uncultured Desulfobacter sp.]|uniref:sigma-54 interaction domain-containing protein n=1 Tax=uncultured Desulfobacter sp. TaxID=240139 RepID=UPI0029F4811E|nr:sigma 54-interacting transcriptional regulator [uncultured Desulfobacter sp.]
METIRQAIEKNELLNQLLDAIGDGVFVLDLTGKIVAWNSAMESITGYSFNEIKGKSCRTLKFSYCFGRGCPSGLHDCKILKTGKTTPTECMINHRDGHALSVSKKARVIRNNRGHIIGVIETVIDLTELKNARLKMEEATRRLGELNRLGGIIAKSQVMQNVFSFIKASAAGETTIFIQGESGTGKELVAGAIHSIGERRDMPMITVNCSALSESLLESELFGHVKGAFTGANRDRIGRFEQADQGTIFLDEIGEISPYIQLKLLRVLQEKEIERVGESKKRKVNIRIITATNKDLKSLVDEGRFREDLYYRLKVFPIFLPPLRDRREDIPLLVNHFIKLNNKISGGTVTGMAKPALKVFMEYDWPGNIRELANAIEHAFVLCVGRQIEPEDLPVEIIGQNTICAEPCRSQPVPAPSGKKQRQPLERDRLLSLLRDSGWNKAEVARQTGFSRAAIWKYMKKWNISMKCEE